MSEAPAADKIPLECNWCDTDWLMISGSLCPICGDLLQPRSALEEAENE